MGTVSDDTIAVVAAQLVRAVIDAQVAATQLSGLSEEGAPTHVEDMFVRMIAVVRENFPVPSGKVTVPRF